MFKYTVSLFALITFAGCAAPVDMDDESGEQESVAEAEEAVSGSQCSTMNADGKAALSAIDGVRTALGMGAINCDNALQTAANKHANYQGVNKVLTHVEDPAKPAYYATQFWERAKKAGFTGQSSFEVASGAGKPADAITGSYGWMSTVYHRIPFVAYQSKWFGFGNYVTSTASKYGTIDFGSGASVPSSTSLAVWPKNSATGVLSTFHCASEGPPPIANCGDMGYPISITGGGDLSISTHTIKKGSASGTSVGHVILTSGNDTNKLIPASQVYLIPNAPLALKTTYYVTMKGTVSGVSFSKSWSFTTGGT